MAGFEINSKKQKKTWQTVILWTAAVFGVLTLMLCAYFSVFDLGIEFYYAMLLPVAAVLTSLLLVWYEKYRKQKLIAFFCVIVVLICAFWEKVYVGSVPYINHYIELRNQFYRIDNAVLIAETNEFSTLFVLLIVEMLLSIFLMLVLEKKKGVFFSVMLMLIPVILAATVGKMPSTESCIGLMGMGCIYVLVCRQNDSRFVVKNVIGAACTFALLLGISSVLKPVILDYKEMNLETYVNIKAELSRAQRTGIKSIHATITDAVSDLGRGGNYAKGGIAEGDLDSLTSFKSTGEIEMEVTVQKRPDSAVYLKAFVGSEYTGEGWEELGTWDFAEVVSPIGGASDRRSLMNEPFRRLTEGERELTKQKMRIQLKGASSKYAYTPYYAEITNAHDVYLDAYIKGNGEKAREYTYYSPDDVSRIEWTLVWEEYSSIISSVYYDEEMYKELTAEFLADASELWGEYQEFVKKNYAGQYPELEELTALCRSMNDENITAEINQWFRGLKYTKEPGKMPDNRDFAEGFLFEKKEGFCVHFATAATLIYRMKGVPARYVEGYMISPSHFKRMADGTYKATVTDMSAHAWCETFDEEYGWQVQEHTLVYGMGQPVLVVEPEEPEDVIEPEEPEDVIEPEEPEDVIEPEEPQTDIQPDAQPDDEQPGEEPTTNGQNPQKNESGIIWKKLVHVGGVCAGSIITLMGLIVLQQKIRRDRKRKRFRNKDRNQGIISIYKAIYDMCAFAGLENGAAQETERQKAQRMAQSFSQLTQEEWNWIYTLAEQATFSGKEFSAKEQKEMYHLYRKLRKGLLKTFRWKKKMWFLYGRAM